MQNVFTKKQLIELSDDSQHYSNMPCENLDVTKNQKNQTYGKRAQKTSPPLRSTGLNDLSVATRMSPLCQRNVKRQGFARAVVREILPQDVKAGQLMQKSVVVEIVHGELDLRNSDSQSQPSLFYNASDNLKQYTSGLVHLRDEWQWTVLYPDDIVHVIGNWTWKDGKAEIVMSSKSDSEEQNNLLIVHPDTIISASRLASLSSCMRKPMLQERVKAPGDSTYIAVLGTILHGLLQACLLGELNQLDENAPFDVPAPQRWSKLGNFTASFIAKEMEKQVVLQRSALVTCNASTTSLREDIIKVIPALVQFGETFLAPRDNTSSSIPGLVEDPRREEKVHLQIRRVLRAESDAVSPMYGLKGRIDLCVEAELADNSGQVIVLLPIEIKTGRVTSSLEHVAQTSLYTLLLEDAYGTPVFSGMLLYLQTSTLRRVHRIAKEIRGLIMARNEMATYKKHLPPLPTAPTDTVSSLDKARQPQSPGSIDSFEDEWDDEILANIPLDTQPGSSFLPPTIDSAYKCQRCYSKDACMLYRRAVDGVLDTDSPIADLYREHTAHLSATDMKFFSSWDAVLSREESGLLRYQNELWTVPASTREALGRCVTGARVVHSQGTECEFDVADRAGWMSLDDMVSVSLQSPEPFFISRGRVVSLSKGRVCLRLDSTLLSICSPLQEARAWPPSSAWLFRLDLDDLMSMMAVPRYNLACLFYANVPECVAALRRRVVHQEVPRWISLPESTCALVTRFTGTCNSDQLAAIQKTLSAQDYALVLGMPGTGKSTTIAALVRILVSLGQSVLLCSHTHSAVDTIVAKLLDQPVLRLGPLSRIHPRVRACALDSKLSREASIEEFNALVESAPIVAATCLATGDAALARRTFDVCIVDEASQITLPTCLGPLRLAAKFVMIGDHYQLSPLVRDSEAASHGMSTSLFQTLCTHHPEAVVPLRLQYRMCDEIMSLSNNLVYEGQLQCGTPGIAQRALILDESLLPTEDWLAAAVSPSHRVVFLDTDPGGAKEDRTDSLVDNATEAAYVAALVRAWHHAGIPLEEIGVLTPYRHQVQALERVCAAEVLTIDQSQGRDWSIVVVSLVRSNAACQVGELLRDQRRVNVMLTRAKMKLVLVGSRTTMEGGAQEAIMPRLMRLLTEHTMIQVPPLPTDLPSHMSPTRPRHVKKARGLPRQALVDEVLEEMGLEH